MTKKQSISIRALHRHNSDSLFWDGKKWIPET